MKKNKLTNIFNILNNNLAIIVIFLVLFSLVSILMINGFRVDYESLDTAPPQSVLVEDRVPALALYYQRDRVNVNIILADESELDEGEVLENITYQARYNSHSIFTEPFATLNSTIPLRDNYLFTHFSLTKGGEPLDPGIRVTEEMTIYANWILKPKVQPYQILTRLAMQIELGIKQYVPYFYEYKVVAKGSTTEFDLEVIPNLTRSDYKAKITVKGTETNPVLSFNYDYDRIERKSIKYNLNGGKLLVPTQSTSFQVPVNGLVFEKPDVTKEGSRFLGWSTSLDGSIMPLQDVVVDKDIELFAIYEPSLPAPNPSTKQGRYLTTYYVESNDYRSNYLVLMITDSIANLNDEISAKEIEIDNFSLVLVDNYSHKFIIFAGQFLIVAKKDKVATLNNKVMSFTEITPLGVIILLLMFTILGWAFLDNRQYRLKHLYWAILLLITGILVLILPQFVNFSHYFQSIWDLSKELNASDTKISMLIGIQLSGSLLLIASVMSFTAYISTLIPSKTKDKPIESSK